MIRYPRPLLPGDLIAVTAPSSGVSGGSIARLDLVLGALRSKGFRVVEGECLRGQHKSASAPRQERAAELVGFLTDPAVAAVMPPWGGELAIELLDLIDFEALRSVTPKWFLGFSDLSTLELPLTLISRWATAHGSNLMDLAPTQTDPLTTSVLDILGADPSDVIVQASSARFQTRWIDYAVQADAPLQLTQPTRWKRLDGSTSRVELRGRLIGGCIDTIARLAGTPYGDVPGFTREAGADGALLFLENCEMHPCELARALWSLRLHGWFSGLSGVLVGRSAGPEAAAPDHLTYHEALAAALGDLPCPVLVDVDIGHQPPQLTLINGALAEVVFEEGRGSVTQRRGGSTPRSSG